MPRGVQLAEATLPPQAPLARTRSGRARPPEPAAAVLHLAPQPRQREGQGAHSAAPTKACRRTAVTHDGSDAYRMHLQAGCEAAWMMASFPAPR